MNSPAALILTLFAAAAVVIANCVYFTGMFSLRSMMQPGDARSFLKIIIAQLVMFAGQAVMNLSQDINAIGQSSYGVAGIIAVLLSLAALIIMMIEINNLRGSKTFPLQARDGLDNIYTGYSVAIWGGIACGFFGALMASFGETGIIVFAIALLGVMIFALVKLLRGWYILKDADPDELETMDDTTAEIVGDMTSQE